MALIDRFHYYLPGWEILKMQNEYLTDHYGFVVDYLAEALRELRRLELDRGFGSAFLFRQSLNTRDAKAVRKTVAGLVKLLHPDGNFRKKLECYLEYALEGRRQVKEQLKKMGAFEYYQTSFSYMDKETMQSASSGSQKKSGSLISTEPLAPGSLYTAAMTVDRVALHRIEVSRMSGNGKLRITGNPDRSMKQSIDTAYDYLRSRKSQLGIEKDIESYDFHVQIIDLMSRKEGSQAGVAFFVALYSLLREMPVQAGLVILRRDDYSGKYLYQLEA